MTGAAGGVNLHQITIAAPPERVFEAITTREGFLGWWTDDAQAEPAIGSVDEFGFFHRSVVFHMRVDALDPPHHLHWTCIDGPEEWVGTEIDFRLGPDGRGGTVAHFQHGGWRTTSGHFPTSNTTWGHLMHRLKAYAEGREPGPYFVGAGVAG
jgi:uncharacterized protein YndB with AHSA1/START domain